MLENNLIYKDNYMFFTFNGIQSKDYNLMIQNTSDSLTIHTNDGASIDYVSPKYQTGRYMVGVTRSHRKLPYKLVAYGLTRSEANEMAAWLRVGTEGALIFDYAPDWKYNVVVATLSDMTLNAIDIEHFIVSFDITFETIEGIKAESVMVASATVDPTLKKDIYICNNTLYIPTIAVYRQNKWKGSRRTQLDNEISFYIHHFGNNSVIDISSTYESGSDTYIDLTICLSDFIVKQYHIQYNRTNNQESVIDYKSHTNLFFINDILPDMQKSHGQIQNLSYSCELSPLSCSTPGKIIEVFNEENWEQLDTLTCTHHNWFIYATKQDPVTTEYANMTAEYFPYQPAGTFYYDHEYITQTGSNKNIDLDTLKQQLNNNTQAKHVYFGFYHIIDCISASNVFQNIRMDVRQYANLIGG